MTKFLGVKHTLGDRDLVIPPLNFKSLQVFQSRLANFTGEVDPASVQLVLEVAGASLRRNYDDITDDWLSDVLDVGNMLAVMEAVMDVSGLRRKAQEAAELAASNVSPLTGPNSTDT